MTEVSDKNTFVIYSPIHQYHLEYYPGIEMFWFSKDPFFATVFTDFETALSSAEKAKKYFGVNEMNVRVRAVGVKV